LKKFAGLFVFIFALAAAIALTKYYSSRPEPAPRTAPAPVAAGDAPAPPARPAPVFFKPRLATLDFASRKSHVTLELERDRASAAPERLWVWAYFFTPEAAGERRYCAGEPVEVPRPFAPGEYRATVTVTAEANACPAPSDASATFYARVNVSTESAFAARLGERQISYDLSAATPVTVEGARPARR
jgi:hypothetical protein